MTLRPASLAPLLCTLVVVTLAACTRSEPAVEAAATTTAPAGVEPSAQSPPMSAPPIEPGAELPPGHPPLDAAGQMPMPSAEVPSAAPPPEAASAMGFTAPPEAAGEQAVAWKVPAGWVSEPPANAMRRAQYRVPGAAGEAECVVFYFGPGQGGDPRSNAERWASQFVTADGKPASAALTTRAAEAGGMKVLFVETRGTYLQGAMAATPVEQKAGYALLGAIVEGPDANWFFKLTGPEKTVLAQRVAFDALIGSVKAGS
jgi:hypothetical protein